MKKGGMDERLATHFAHLFIRDPITAYKELLDSQKMEKKCDGEEKEGESESGGNCCDSTDPFENIQSTNWQTVRFKPPPFVANDNIQSFCIFSFNSLATLPDYSSFTRDSDFDSNSSNSHSNSNFPPSSPSSEGNIGWRVEFRGTEIQPTNRMNAAFVVYILLLSSCILDENLCFYMPISLIDENLKRAQERDAISQNKFHFRTNIEDKNSPAIMELMSIHEIINGKVMIKSALKIIFRLINHLSKDLIVSLGK